MTTTEHSGRRPDAATLALGGAALAGAAAGGTWLLRRFDAWALAAITQPARRPLDATPADFGLAYEEIRLHSEDRVDLYGWLIPAPAGAAQARGTVILGHGHGDTISSLLGVVGWLQPAGYNVLLFDFRAHGRSGGTHTSVGYLEHRDVAAGLAFLAVRGIPRAGFLGWSLGGAVGIVSGALFPQIAGVIADSTYARLSSALSQAAVQLLHWPPRLAAVVGRYGERLVARSLGYDHADARPEALVGRISPRPLLIIHSVADDLIPVANAEILFERAGDPKELWITPAGAHAVGPAELYPDEYRARVLGFWGRVFPGPAGG